MGTRATTAALASASMIVATIALACEPAQEPRAVVDPSLEEPPRIDDPTRADLVDVQRVARRIADLRGVALKEPLRVSALDDAEFKNRYARGSLTAQTPRAGNTNAFWYGFGFARPAVQVGETSKRVLEEQVVGFYDHDDKTLFVRGAIENGFLRMARPKDRLVLVHEIEHALQDQSFGIRDRSDLDDDARLAQLAVYEGDAMLSMLAYEAAVVDGFTEHWVSRMTAKMRDMTVEQLVGMGEHSKEILGAPALMQRRMLFPYFNGLMLLADVYRAGGLPLLDAVFRRPPISTEQVLDPNKYVAGEQPVPVSAPSAPAGYKLVVAGKMGELQTRVLLDECANGPRGKAQGAIGWGGDAYALVVDAAGRLSILWSTVWDVGAAAERFEAAMRERQACLEKRLDGDARRSLGVEVTVLREGDRVAYVQGLRPDERESAARALLGLAGGRPAASPPLGANVSVPPLIDPDRTFLRRGSVRAKRWSSAALGTSMPVPDGWARSEDDGVEIELERKAKGSYAMVGMGFLFATRTPSTERRYLRRFVSGVRDKIEKLRYVGEARVETGAGAATGYDWAAPNGAHIRVAFLSACKGKGTFVFFMVWAGQGSQDAIDGALGRFAADDRAPACTWLRDAID